MNAEYVEDKNGNRATIAYWGSVEAAEASLKTLINCSGCCDCSRCCDCSGCSGCCDCSDCSRCSRCSDCSRCSRCSDCSDKEGDHTQPVIPAIPDIHRKVYAAASAENALDMSSWHNACGTAHCRAGWVVALAGEEGRALEAYWGTPHAAWLIYNASDPAIKAYPDFYTTNERALADMARLAGVVPGSTKLAEEG